MKKKITLDAVVVDASAIMSIFDGRASAEAFKEAIKRCKRLRMSAGTLAELSILLRSRKGVEGPKLLDDYIAAIKVAIVAFDSPDLDQFRQGCDLFGKGHNPASLNYGDLFSYSLAKKLGLPILFEGLDFSKTDLVDAMKVLGYSFTEKHSPYID